MHHDIEDMLPLSPLQQGLLFQHLYDEGAPDAYLVQTLFELDGPLDAEALHAAAQNLLRRHPNLRASFMQSGFNEPVQIIPREIAVPWRLLDLSRHEPAARETAHAQVLHDDRAQAFQAAHGPLLRFTLVRLGERQHQLIFTNHHLLLDGWSMPIFLDELFALYRSRGATPLPRVTPYRNYLAWLRQQDQAAAQSAWRKYLDGVSEATRLAPTTSGKMSMLPQVFNVRLGASLSEALQQRARVAGVTLNTLFQAAWALWLSRHTGRNDVIFGITVSGRPPEIAGVEQMVGLFINTVPLRVTLDPAQSMQALLLRLQAEQVALLDHQHLGLAQIQQLAGIGELFDTHFIFENLPLEQAGVLGAPDDGLHCRYSGGQGGDVTHYPLGLMALPGADMELRFGYRPDLFDQDTVARLAQRLVRVLDAIAYAPQQAIGVIDLLDKAEREQVVVNWNATTRALPASSFPLLFEQQVSRAPDAIAAVFEQERLTYAELNARANRLAHALVAQGIGPEQAVAVALPRSLDMLVALLAVLKSGAAYLPLDLDYPAERLAYMLDDAQPALVLARSDAAVALPAHQAIWWLDQHSVAEQAASDLDDRERTRPLHADHPAYVIYTSGSTGRPKGVAVRHAGLSNFLHSMREQPGIAAGETLLACTPISFDIAALELYLPLLQGACVQIVPRAVSTDGLRLRALLDAVAPQAMQATPATWQMLREAGWQPAASLRVLCGGEALPPELASFLRQGAALWNLYGPTETTVWSLAEHVGDGPVRIGRP
ncbi:non-ribosomal peptide synthetase, partial [Dyella tabacisoli]